MPRPWQSRPKKVLDTANPHRFLAPVLGIWGPACIALVSGVAPVGPRSDAGGQLSTHPPPACDEGCPSLPGTDGPRDALALCREAIGRFGDDPANRSVDPILLTYARLHRSPADRIALQHEISTLAAGARCAGRRTLAARCAWLLARIAKRGHPESTRQTFLGLARDVPPELLPPAIAIEVAEHLVADHPNEAEPILRHLSRLEGTAESRRALAALGLIAASRGDPQEALAIFETFERENARSALLPGMLERHAETLAAQGRHAEAIGILNRLLALPRLKPAISSRALCRIGEAQEALGLPDKAMPYYQRAKALCGDDPGSAAKAYLACGRIFEALQQWDSARLTYEEFLRLEEPGAPDARAIARERLDAIP